MAKTTAYNARKALDRWAVTRGHCANFDTYLATGGSFLAALDDLVAQREQIELCIGFIRTLHPARIMTGKADANCASLNVSGDLPVVGPDALARAEAEQHGEVDAHNAAIQGAEG